MAKCLFFWLYKIMTTFRNYGLQESYKPRSFMGRKIVYVDTKKFRSSSLGNEEFCTSGIHEDFPKSIAKDEIYIDDSLSSEEIPTVLRGVEARIKSLNNGNGSRDSYENGMRAEKKFRSEHQHKVKRLYKYATLKDSSGTIDVYAVSGLAVRDKHKTDFSQGGHGYVYDWIPKDEIWLEEEESDEFPFILCHEYTEMVLMRDLRIEYLEAHKVASMVEGMCRNGGFSELDFGEIRRKSYDLLRGS